MSRPFTFGVMSNGGSTTRGVVDLATRVEELGFDALHFNDHYLGPGAAMQAANHAPQELAPMPIATLAATATRSLTIGFRVLCVDYHNPVVLAKELATLDQVSDGRLDIGLGAGWIESEYDAMGIGFDPPAVRIARLGKVVDLLRQWGDDGPVDMTGPGVRAHGFSGAPAWAQQPMPPIAIGGSGPRVLALAARVADIVTFNLDNRLGRVAPENVARTMAGPTLEKVRAVRAGAGDRREEIELEVGAYYTFVTADVDDTVGRLAAMTRGSFDLAPEDVLDHPHALIGDVDRICDTLEARRERYGFHRIVVLDHVVEAFAPVVERLRGR